MGLIIPMSFLMVLSIILKMYYEYKFDVADELKTEPVNILKFFVGFTYIHRYGDSALFPLLRNSPVKTAQECKYMANFYLIMFYLCLTFILGAGLLLGEPVTAP